MVAVGFGLFLLLLLWCVQEMKDRAGAELTCRFFSFLHPNLDDDEDDADLSAIFQHLLGRSHPDSTVMESPGHEEAGAARHQVGYEVVSVHLPSRLAGR